MQSSEHAKTLRVALVLEKSSFDCFLSLYLIFSHLFSHFFLEWIFWYQFFEGILRGIKRELNGLNKNAQFYAFLHRLCTTNYQVHPIKAIKFDL